MAKEMMIVFIYDTSRCRKEDDDPADAVMYFHPAWVSPTQRLALAGQLMGVNHFLSTSFSPPNLISLQGGKFVVRKFGQYILAVGTDRNIHDWILERRANTLESILKFFHCDLETISSSFNNDRNKFTEKLYQMLETYLPILQYSANLFSNIPIIKLPKGASNVFLEAMQVLQYCQETSGIMGGALFYNNKVVATQLNAELTKQLVITDPYRIKAPADRIPTSFHLPLGVQLLRVYVHRRHSFELPDDSNITTNSKTQTACFANTADVSVRKNSYKKIISASGMKRDSSRIFTVPEEGESCDTTTTTTHPTMDEPRKNATRVPPPATLPLVASLASISNVRKSTIDHKNERPKYPANPPLTPSVCSTPLKDVNRVLHGNAVSICSANDEIDDKRVHDDNPQGEKKSTIDEKFDDIPDVVKEALRCKRLNKLRNSQTANRDYVEKKLHRDHGWNRKSSSMSDLDDYRDAEDGNERSSIDYRLSSSYSVISKLHRTDDQSANVDQTISKKRRYFSTINDPCYPVFRHDGKPVSQCLYDHYVATHFRELVKQQNFTIPPCKFDDNAKNKIANGNPISEIFHIDTTSLKNFNVNDTSSCNELGNVGVDATTTKPCLDVRLDDKNRQENYRRSMSLPLKSLNAPAKSDAKTDDPRRKSTSECDFDPPLQQHHQPAKKKLEGLQLTPLMSKLSLLAGDERTSGFCSRDTTPSEFCDLSTFSSRATRNKSDSTTGARTLGGRSVVDDDSAMEDDVFWLTGDSAIRDNVGLEKTELFICGHHNMVLFLLMEDGTGNNPDLIHNLWETCINTLGRLESRLQQCLDPLPSNDNKELYSVLSVDPQWDTLHRSGLWGVTELDIVSSLHNRFTRASNLTDIIVRTDDIVVYGSKCGNTEVFYQQAMAPNVSGGLPTPADLMGVVPLKAKRRLERDHGIIIL